MIISLRILISVWFIFGVAYAQNWSKRIDDYSEALHCLPIANPIVGVEKSLGINYFTSTNQCSVHEFEKDPCGPCYQKEPKFNRSITSIRKAFMSEKNMEERMLKAQGKLWNRKLQQVFHNVLYFDAVLKDPSLKSMVGGFEGAKKKVVNLNQCSFAAMKVNFENMVNGKEINNKELDESKLKISKDERSVGKNCAKNKSKALARFKTFFGGLENLDQVFEKYRTKMSDLSNNNLVEPAQCLPYKAYVQVMAIPSEMKEFISDEQGSDATVTQMRKEISELKNKIENYESVYSNGFIVIKDEIRPPKSELELELKQKELKFNRYISSIASNPLLGFLESRNPIDIDNKYQNDYAKLAKNLDHNQLENKIKSDSELLNKSMEYQNQQCANLFSNSLPEILCADEILPNKEVLLNADYSDFYERDKRTFLTTLLCEDKKCKKDERTCRPYGYKEGAEKPYFGSLGNVQSPLEGYNYFDNEFEDEKINNNKVTPNSSYKVADELFCKIAKECVPDKQGKYAVNPCDQPQLMIQKFSQGIKNLPLEEQIVAQDFIRYYSRMPQDPKTEAGFVNIANPDGRNVEDGQISMFTNYMTQSDEKIFSDFTNPQIRKEEKNWEPIPVRNLATENSFISNTNSGVEENPVKKTESEKRNQRRTNINNQVNNEKVVIENNNVIENSTNSILREDIPLKKEQTKAKDSELEELRARLERLKKSLSDWDNSKNGKSKKESVSSQAFAVKSPKEKSVRSDNIPFSFQTKQEPSSVLKQNLVNERNDNIITTSGKDNEAKAKSKEELLKELNEMIQNPPDGVKDISNLIPFIGQIGKDGFFTEDEKLVPDRVIQAEGLMNIVRYLDLEGKRFRSYEYFSLTKGVIRTYDIILEREIEKMRELVVRLKSQYTMNKKKKLDLTAIANELEKVRKLTRKISEKVIKNESENLYYLDKTLTEGEVNYYFLMKMKDELEN